MAETVSNSSRRSGLSHSRSSRQGRDSNNSKMSEHDQNGVSNQDSSVNGEQGQGVVSNNAQHNYDSQYPNSIPMFYPGITDMADALEALPMEIIHHFTLLREIDAKCVTTTPELTRLIKEFLDMPLPARELEEAAETAGGPNRISIDVQSRIAELASERERVLYKIRMLIRELMPCLEEKMHVAGVAADAINRHVARLNYDFDELIVKNNEIPHEIRYGPEIHPAYRPIVTAAEKKQNTRSEARREAMAARKAAQAVQAQQATSSTTAASAHASHAGNGSGRNTPRTEDTKSSRGGIKTNTTNGRGAATNRNRKGNSSASGSNNANSSNTGRNTNNSHSTNHGAELSSTKVSGHGSGSHSNAKGGSRTSNREDNDDTVTTGGRKRSDSLADSACMNNAGASSRGGALSSSNFAKRRKTANNDDVDGNSSFQADKRSNCGKVDRFGRADGEDYDHNDGDRDDDAKPSSRKSNSGGNSKKKSAPGYNFNSGGVNDSPASGNSLKKKKSGSVSSGPNNRSLKNGKRSSNFHGEDEGFDEDGDHDIEENGTNGNDNTETNQRKRAYDNKAGNGDFNSETKTATRAESETASNAGDAEQIYCYCQQVSYGEMVACDGPHCDKEWFHLPCIGMSSPPDGKWFCRDCKKEIARQKRNQGNVNVAHNNNNGNSNNSSSSNSDGAGSKFDSKGLQGFNESGSGVNYSGANGGMV